MPAIADAHHPSNRSPAMSGPSRLPRLGVALLVLLAAALLPARAQAHQRLLRTEPARDALVQTAPRELRLVFNEAIELAFTRVELVGPDAAVVAIGEPSSPADSNTVLVVPVTEALRAGRYTVRWSAASRDGHPVHGEYAFTIAPDALGLAAETPTPGVAGEAAGTITAPGQADPPAAHHPVAGDPATSLFAADSPGYVAVRWITYLALLGVIGAAAFAPLVLGTLRRRTEPVTAQLVMAARPRAAAAGLAFVALLAFAAVARLYAQSLAMHGVAEALDSERIAAMLARTVWGWGWLLQATAAMVAGVGFTLARRGRPGGWVVGGLGAVALAATPALSGHAAARTGVLGGLAVAADALHVLSAGGWLGSLLILLLAGIPVAVQLGPGRRGAAVATLVRAFSPAALLFAGLLVATGLFGIILHSPSATALLGSRYGALLLLKLGIFLLVAGTGAYNFRRVLPVLGDDAGTARLRRSSAFELGVGAAVLLVTAVLVATAPPGEDAPQPTEPTIAVEAE